MLKARTFEAFNQSGTDVCPLCGTNEDAPVVLVPIFGTESGGCCQAAQVHVQCLCHDASRFGAVHDTKGGLTLVTGIVEGWTRPGARQKEGEGNG